MLKAEAFKFFISKRQCHDKSVIAYAAGLYPFPLLAGHAVEEDNAHQTVCVRIVRTVC